MGKMAEKIRGLWVKTTAYFALGKEQVLVTLLIFLGLVLLGVLVGYHGYRYVWISPNFCYACHIHDYANEAWESSVHMRSTTCHDCHQEGLGYYLKVSYAMLFDRPTFPEDLHHPPIIPSQVCRTCHTSHPEKTQKPQTDVPPEDIARFPKVDQTRLHAIHLEQDYPLDPVRKIDCYDCHGSEKNRAHKFRATEENCWQCHRESKHVSSVRLSHQIPCSKCHFVDFVSLGGIKE